MKFCRRRRRSILPNGHLAVIDMAVRVVNHPLAVRYRKSIILGALREDVWYFPVIGSTWEHLSISHFYKPPLPGGFIPFVTIGARHEVNRFFRRALREYRAGRVASAFVQFGRGNHILADMLCPVHSQRVFHQHDPFEWHVETHIEELKRLPVPAVEDGDRPSDFVEGLARFAGQFPVDARLAAEQARQLVPMGAAYTAAHLRMFLRAVERT